MDWMQWYDQLAKPSWTPPPDTIRTIWSFLYPIIAVTFGYVFVQAWRQRLPGHVALPFVLNLISNLAFMPIFVGLRDVNLATADIAIVWLTLVWAVVAVWPHAHWIAYAQLPYFLWLTIAGVLQLSIRSLNATA